MATRTLGMILAGGQGSRLAPLTAKRSKPAVPFGSKYRIIDFALNNFINSGIYSIYVLTQFKAQSLTEHIQRGWRFGSFLSDYFITLVPAQQYRFEELGAVWYRGTADAVYQNMHLIDNHKTELVAIFSGDHIYKMNVAHTIDQHEDARADISIAAFPVPLAQASRFGVLQVDNRGRVIEFQEKPKNPSPMPDRPDMALASMGNYIFNRKTLEELLDAYHEASMDLVSAVPEFDLYNPEWPIRTVNTDSPPAKFVHEGGDRTGQAFNSLIAGGVIISGSTVRESILFRRARVNSYSNVTRSVLFDEVEIGRHCEIHNTIIDKDVTVPSRTQIGVDHEADIARGFKITESGIVIVPKSYKFK